MKTYLFTYSLAVLLSMALMPLVILWARKQQFIDVPNVRKVHTSPIARVGGVAIFISTILAFLPVLSLQNIIGEKIRDRGIEISAFLIGSGLMFVVGLYDDLKGLRARTKLGLQLFAASIVCSAGVYIQQITIRDLCVINLGWLGYLISIIWIIGITNAINLIDGLDGLAAGISAIACAVMAVLSIWQGNVILAVIMLALLGSLSGFLFYNFHPAKVFMGDCGSLFLGFTIAAASVLTASKSEALIGMGLPILVLGIPIFDTLFSMLRRFLERRDIMSPDRSHFHHRLLEFGIGQRQVVMIAYMVTLLITGLGCFMLVTQGALSVIILLCCLILLLLVFRVIGAIRLRDTLAGIHRRTELSHQKFMERQRFEEAQLNFRNAQTLEQWWRCLCMAAEALGCAKVCLDLASAENGRRNLIWRKGGHEYSGREDEDVMHVSVPVCDLGEGRKDRVEFDILTHGSIEAAGRRIALLTRLAEENDNRLMSFPHQDQQEEYPSMSSKYPEGQTQIVPVA